MDTPIDVRILQYKSLRHYGGREITVTSHLCKAEFIKHQQDHTVVVRLLADCAGYKDGHIIAINPCDFDV